MTSSSKPVPARVVSLGIETQRQKAELETALFGEPSTPIEIGHYTVIGTLGSGGMGVVYVAHDQQLGRRVALKLLRHANASEIARVRLLREAQAMARLQHPNVVTVHEVGTYNEQVFLAMEFVGGANLRAWLHMRKRTWREIIATFSQAGEGLAAAHAAGITHRDFKPDNVLVGDDGRVRVADFGLAHGTGIEIGEPTPDTPDSIPGLSSISGPLTETGMIVGTPAYMAPEQHHGGRVDARSDQFSFCVALWEAMYGKRPFSGTSVAELSVALRENLIQTPVDPGDVPPWLHRVILRGISINPDDRWPSMKELLVALARDPQRVRRRRISIATLTISTLSIILSLSVRAATESRHNARQRYWNELTEELLDIERERGLQQATDDARRARNATRMSSYRRYRPEEGRVDHEDPTVAAALLREVEGSGRETQAWISAANEILGQPISYAVLAGHRNVILDVAFAPDSSAVYSASNDNEVRRWELATGVGRPIISHAREVVAVAVSPDGRLVASGSKDHTARLWSVDHPESSRVIAEHDGELTEVAFDPTGHLLATSSKDGTIQLIDLSGGLSGLSEGLPSTPRTLAGHAGPVFALSFSADGTKLLTSGDDESARLWQVTDGSQLATFTGHDKAVYHARFLDDDNIVTGSDDGGVRLWNVRAPNTAELLTRHADAITALDVHGDRVASAAADYSVRIVSIDGHRPTVDLEPHAAVWSLAFVAEGEQLVTSSFDGSARLWSSHGGKPLRTFMGHREAMLRVAVDPSGRWLATGSYDTDLRLWDLRRPRLRQSLEGHTQQVSDIVLDPAERRIATASHDGNVRLWDIADGSLIATLHTEGDAVYSVVFSPDGTHLAAGTRSGISLWRLDDQSMRVLEGHENEVWQVSFDSTGQRLASASLDGTVRVWSVDQASEQLLLRGHTDMVTSVQFEPGDRRIISAGNDGTLRIWDAHTGANLASWHGHDGKIWRMVRSPDGRTLATASDDGTAKLWPDDDPSHVIVLRGHRQPVWSVAFDAGGSRVVTASWDKDARIWSTADGSVLRTLSGHTETVWGARFTADGRVVTASEDNTLRVWPRDLGDPVIILSGHGDAVTALALNREGTRLISGSADATAKIWQLDRLQTDVEPLQRRLREATIWCLSVDRRIRELSEEAAEASHAFEACEASYGRGPAPGTNPLPESG